MLWLLIRDWILWVANFRFPFYEICVHNQWGMKFWNPFEDSNTGGMTTITVTMQYLLAFQCWYWELWTENRWGRGRKHCFNNFCFLAKLELSVDEGWWGRAENLIYGQLELHLFTAWILFKTISMTHSDMLWRLDIFTFCFYEPLLFQIVSWKFLKA